MEIILYGDIFFLINFLFDTLLLYITARITNTPFKLWRLVLASALASVYAFLCLVLISTLPLHLISAFMICFTVFGKKRPFLNTAVFLLSSALSGGAVYGLFYMAGKNEEYIRNLGAGAVVICLLSALSLTAGYLYVCKKNSAAGAVYAYIYVLGKSYKAFLMKDTGNLLTDPISLDPVMVISKKVFGKEFENIDTSPPLPIRAIPVRTATGRDILYGFRPEKCVVREFGKSKKREVKVIIAVTDENRFANTYEGLMPPI